jgi:hypothetical protein
MRRTVAQRLQVGHRRLSHFENTPPSEVNACTNGAAMVLYHICIRSLDTAHEPMLRFSGTPPEGKQKMTNLLLQGRYVCPLCGLQQDESCK